MAPDEHRRDDFVRAGADEVAFGRLIDGARDDVKVRIEPAGGENDIDILGITRRGRDQRRNRILQTGTNAASAKTIGYVNYEDSIDTYRVAALFAGQSSDRPCLCSPLPFKSGSGR